MTLLRLSFACAVVVAIGAPASAQDRCPAARDLMTSTLNRIEPDGNPAALKGTLDDLRRVTQMCPGLGDAYYYLGLIGEVLKDPRAAGWRQQAKLLESEAMKANAPFAGGSSDRPVATSTSTSVASPAPTRVSAYVRRKLALVVAVATFKDARINALRYTTADGRAFAETLRTDLGFDEVTTLFDEEATTYRVKTAIDQLARTAGPDDLVVLYFASHGSPEDLDTAGVNYIVTFDTEVSNLYATAYPMEDLAGTIGSRIKAERVVAFLDTCYSGGTFRELPKGWASSSRTVSADKGLTAAQLQARIRSQSRAVVVDSDPAPSNKRQQGVGRVIITASGQSERSWEDEKIEHGYFTFYLLQALRAPGTQSVEDIFAHLRVKVPEAVRREQNQAQTPTIARDRDRIDLYLRDAAATPIKKQP